MKKSILIGIALLLGTFAGCSDWAGFGFDASGPEMPRLRQIMLLKPGMTVADVGAGKGELAFALARDVGPTGRVYANDVNLERLAVLRAEVAKRNLANVTIVEAKPRETGLPAACCDAIVLRRVYHHLTNPADINAGLLRALRPGGFLVVIDLPPPLGWIWPWPPEGVPKNRGGHGIPANIMTAEVTASGFVLKEIVRTWPGPWPLDTYCAVFQKPLSSHDV